MDQSVWNRGTHAGCSNAIDGLSYDRHAVGQAYGLRNTRLLRRVSWDTNEWNRLLTAPGMRTPCCCISCFCSIALASFSCFMVEKYAGVRLWLLLAGVLCLRIAATWAAGAC